MREKLLTLHPVYFSIPALNKQPADPGLGIQPERSSHDLDETQLEPKSFMELGLLIL